MENNKDASLAQKPVENIQQNSNSSSSENGKVITQLTLAGLKVLMVRNGDQIIYKLPDNMQVSSIGEEQRQQLMKEIQALHAATMTAAANAQLQQQKLQHPNTDMKAIAPKSETVSSSLDTPPQPTAAEADAIKETARKLREELEQQQQMQFLQQQHQAFRSSPGFDSNPSSPHDTTNKTTRKYNKTGKYSKKKQQQMQQQLHQHFSQQLQYPNQSQQQLTQQQLLALQQSLQQQPNVNINTVFKNILESASTPSTPTTPSTNFTSTPISTSNINNTFSFNAGAQQQHQLQGQGNASSSVLTTPPAITQRPNTSQQAATKSVGQTDTILGKRLPEEETQHREIKKKFMDSLLADHKRVSMPDYRKPFKSIQDAIDRLLPYHIYQYPKSDLDANKIPLDRQDHTMIEIFKCQTDLFEKHAAVAKKIEQNDGSIILKVLVERQVLTEQRQKLTEEQTRVAAEQAAQQQEQLRIQAEKVKLIANAEQQARQQQHLQQQTQFLQQLQPFRPQSAPGQVHQQDQYAQYLQQAQYSLAQSQQAQQTQVQPIQQAPQQAIQPSATINYAQVNALLQNPQFVNYYKQLTPELQQKLLKDKDRNELAALIEKHQQSNNLPQ